MSRKELWPGLTAYCAKQDKKRWEYLKRSRECAACKGTKVRYNKEQDRYEKCFLCQGEGIVYE